MSKEELPLFNLSDPEQTLRLIRHIGTLRGVHRVKLSKVRDQISDNQRAYIFAVCYPYVAKGLRDAWEEKVDSYDAHEFLKERFLKIPVVNRKTGEVKGYRVPSIMSLNVEECSKYIEEIHRFSAEELGIVIPPAVRYASIEAVA